MAQRQEVDASYGTIPECFLEEAVDWVALHPDPAMRYERPAMAELFRIHFVNERKYRALLRTSPRYEQSYEASTVPKARMPWPAAASSSAVSYATPRP